MSSPSAINSGHHILLAEDEQHLAMGISDNLMACGHEVTVVSDGLEALRRMEAGGIDLIVLDVMLPNQDGYHVCQALRKRGDITPILFLTAKNTTEERVHGLALGGDDYLGKPFHLQELISRVAALLRRSRWQQQGIKGASACLNLGGVLVDFGGLQMIDRHGRTEDVPSKEMAILRYLWSRADEVVSRDDILDAVWGHDVYPSTRTVDNFIVRLRRRFEVDVLHPQFLLTVRGVGYKLNPQGGAT